METVTKNHPRFCAQYRGFIGCAVAHRFGWLQYFEIDGMYYVREYGVQDYQVGDTIYVAKKIPLPGHHWNIHAMTVPETFWNYESYQKRTPKQQREQPYEPYPQTWFNHGRVVVVPYTVEQLKRKFRQMENA